MIKTTREQRLALKRVFDRNPVAPTPEGSPRRLINGKPMTYRQFRTRAQPSFDGSGCIMLFWCGMWLGIEKDGYTHS